jgi:predicted secreted Zn-dependent protease
MKLCKMVLLLFFIICPIVFAAPSFTEHQTYYKINGKTAEELRSQMTNVGPLDGETHVDAKTSWNVTWNFTWHYDTPYQNPCYLTSIHVNTDITYLYPDWINQAEGNPALQTKWKDYLATLDSHEKEHANNGKLAGEEIEKALKNLPQMPNCKVLQDTVNETAKKIISQHNEWDIKHDTETQYGKSQGAVFP